jgi:hypothetical protein
MVVVPSVLDAVTVHAEGALCTRLATLRPDNGRLPMQVRIEGLPLTLRPGTLRASILKGPAELVVRDLRPAFDVRLPPETDIPATQRALEEAQEMLASLGAELERVQRDIQSLQKLRPAYPPRKEEPPEPRETALTAILALAGFVDTELATLHERRLDLERRLREATEEVELRRRRLEEGSSSVRGQRALLYRAAVLTLSEVGALQEGVQLALEYAVRGARWVPGYDLRMPPTLEGGTLQMRASVIQRTGEDWRNVRLSLSTADLERRAEVPELKSLRIGRHQPAPARSGWREPPPGLDELFSGYDAAGRPAPPPVRGPRGQVRGERSEVREFAIPAMAPQGQPLGGAPPPPAPPPMSAPVAKPMPPRAGGPPPASAAAPLRTKGGNVLRRREAPGARAPEPELDKAVLDAEAAPLEALSEGFGGGGGPMEEPTPEPPALEVAGDLLDYDHLTLAAADQPGLRGRLQAQPAFLSQELIALAAIHVQVDVTAFIAWHERTAASVQHVAPPAWAVPPRESSPHFDYRFDVESRAEVPSDGTWHTLPVFSAPVGLVAEYVCVPSMEPRAFRTVKVENRTPHALLAGPVDVTLGDEFLMTSPLPTLVPGAVQRLGLGVEESLKVSRNTRFEEASGGVFGGATVLTHHVSIELANRLAQPITVEVHERVPAVPASEKDVKVEEQEVQPPWHKRPLLPEETPVEGERAWRVTLKPGERQALNATWAVRIPSSKMLQGGNRRT